MTPDPGVGGSTGGGATGGTAGSGGSSGSVSNTGGTGGGTGGVSGGGGTAGAGATAAVGATGGSGVGGASGGSGGAVSGSGGAYASGAGGTAGGGSSAGGKSGGAGASGSGAAGTGGSGGATASSGCGKMPPAGDRFSIDVDGAMREYILALPEDYDPSRAYRLVFTWHPLGGSAAQVAGNGLGGGGYYGLRNQANGSAIFVSPEGLPFNGDSLGWANTGGRDIAFLQAMLDRFKGELCVDENRIFSTGFSFGGMMSYTVGCAMGGVFRAIAPMVGNSQVSGCEDGDQPVAMMGFHGLDDQVVAIDGGRRARDVFVERNGCGAQTMPLTPTWCDSAGSNYQPCNCVSYQGCTAGYPVVWCEFTGPHTPAPNSAATIWSFFSQF